MCLKNHIPNTITSMNLLCGVLGVVASFNGRQDLAFALMLAASVFDFCDGYSARAMGAYSEIGKELDSLSDDVSFGVLPAVMMSNAVASTGCAAIWKYIPLLLAVFTALRLAKFNVDDRQHSSFIGLPSPASAIVCGSLCSFIYSCPASWLAVFCSHCWVLPLLSVILSALLVSEIPMFAMKFGKERSVDASTARKLKLNSCAIIVSIILVLVFGLHWTAFILLSFLAYIIINLF